MQNREIKYWVVSPNVNNNNHTVGEWRQASVTRHVAFMGWGPNDQQHGRMGPKFAGNVLGGIEAGDVILIARRHQRAPEIVGFGVVDGEAYTSLPGFHPPGDFGSLRRLRPFVPWSGPAEGVPLAAAVGHTRALAQLYPDSNGSHRKICEWMDGRLQKLMPIAPSDTDTYARVEKALARRVAIVSSPKNSQLDYELRSRHEVKRALKREALLLEDYAKWLGNQDRQLESVKYGALQCDGYEKLRNNLLEAKSSNGREHIRMAVGQLLDYAFQGKTHLRQPNLAVLLPDRPSQDIESWLNSLKIRLVWPDGTSFVDNANGQFT